MRAYEFTKRQPLTEAVIATMLASWAAGRALSWLKGKITNIASQNIEKKIKENETLEAIDQYLAQILGSHKGAIGSVLTSFAMALVFSKGQALEAALATVGNIAMKYVNEYTGVAPAKRAASQIGKDILSGNITWEKFFDQLRSLEPAVDRMIDAYDQITDPEYQNKIEPAQIVQAKPAIDNANPAVAPREYNYYDPNEDPLRPYIAGHTHA